MTGEETVRAVAEAETVQESIFRLSRSWMESKAFMTAVKLDVFTVIGDRSKTAAQVAREIRTEEDSTELLLNVLAALGYLKREGQGFSNSDISSTFLVRGKDSYFGYIAVHSDATWDTWGKLEKRLRTGRPVGRALDRSNDPEYVRNFVYQTHGRSVAEAENLSRELDLSQSRKLLDLGGGSGTFSMAFCQANPQLQIVLFDRPLVVEVTKELIAAAGLPDRIKLKPGDFRTDSLGEGFDTAFVSAVVHLLDAKANRMLVRKVCGCLDPGGKIIIRDQLTDEPGVAPTYGAIQSLNFTLTRRGARIYSFSEIKEWLEAAGFVDITKIDSSYQTPFRPGRFNIIGMKPVSGAKGTARRLQEKREIAKQVLGRQDTAKVLLVGGRPSEGTDGTRHSRTA